MDSLLAEVFQLSRSSLKLRLDRTPTGEEEERAFPSFVKASGASSKHHLDPARTRIDKLSRRLALGWTAFLMYIVVAQGNADGVAIRMSGYYIPLVPHFHLKPSEFITVVTTTTASVFIFLTIIARSLFNAQLDLDAASEASEVVADPVPTEPPPVRTD